MRVAIDAVGRLVLPKPLRDELGIGGPTELDVVARDGVLEVTIAIAAATAAALSRMPEGHRVARAVVLEWLERRFPDAWLALDGEATRAALAGAVAGGIRGGALYDALIEATARHHGATLISADRRAAAAYRTLDVDVRLLA